MPQAEPSLTATAPSPAWANPSALRTLHERAVDAVGLIERDYSFAGMTVRIRYAGRALLDCVGPAIAHLETPPRNVSSLVVCVWDAASTGTPPPDFPDVDAPRDGERARYYTEADDVRASYQPSNGMLSVCSASTSEAWYWADDAATLPFLDAAEPMRQILHWWLGDCGVQMLHGGAVGRPDGGVLVTGRNGSGKSTVALASLGSALRYAGDDYVAVDAGEPPRLYSLYNSGKLERHHVALFQELLTRLPRLEDVADEKAVIFVSHLYEDCVITDFPLRAIVVPTVTDRAEARLGSLAPAQALAALAPTTLFQHHPPQPNALASMAALVGDVPTLSLEIGSDLASIPEAILRFLDGAG